MPTSGDLLNQTISGIVRGLALGAELFEDFSLEDDGLALPEDVLTAPALASALDQQSSAAQALNTAADELAAAIEAEAGSEILASSIRAIDALRVFIQRLTDLINTLETAIQSSSGFSGASEKNVALAILQKQGERFLQRLLANIIADYSEPVLLFLAVLGLADWKLVPADGDRLEYVKKSLHLERIKDLIQDPEQHFIDTIRWGASDFDPTEFFNIYRSFWATEADIGVGIENGHPFLRMGSFFIIRKDIDGDVGIAILYRLEINEDTTARTELGEEWGIGLTAGLQLNGEVGIDIAPPFNVDLVPPSGSVGGSLQLVFDRNLAAQPWVLADTGGLILLSVKNVQAGLGLSAEVHSSGNFQFEPMLLANMEELRLKIGSEDGDSFLSKIIAGAELEAVFDLGLEFVPSKGLRVQAAGGVEIMLPIHKDLGPLRLDTFFLGLYIKEDGTLDLETSLGLGANLGPLKAVVERMGAKTVTKFIDGADAEYGNIDSGLKFKPPTGVGLSLDAGVIKGGGYLYIDADRGEYAGALELTFSEWIALKAIGLISTRLPDGSKGFSLLIIVTVEFGSGIQLGFGFTLIGVGGLLGLNRRTDIDALSASIRTGAIESVMFPQNIIENAPKIISDLRAFFPAEEGTFLIGPMVKIGWGTPTLMSLSMGVIIEVPDPTITILGVLKVVLPTEEADVLRLQVNFIGRIEFSNQLAWFYAELFDSRVLFITLEGGLGVLINWSENSNFVVSVGGFHPDFTPPPLPFPEPPRIAVSILDTEYAKVRIEGYFAVTSNSVQFGARAELFFGVSAFNIEGHLGFDALFIFSPFYFSFRLSVKLSVKVFGIGLFSVGFSGKLEGPTPWHIKGKGSISLLFFSISVPFEHTWGDERNTELPPIEVLPLLETELNAISNWQANLPAGVHLLVSLRKLGEGDEDQLVLHPVGTLSVSQRKLPLGVELEKFGNQVPSDVRELTVDVESGFNKLADRKEQFAIGHFKDLKEEEKLSKPAFQPLNAGLDLSVAGDQTRTSGATARSMRYEQLLIDGAFRRRIVERLVALLLLIIALLRLIRRNAVRQNELSATRQAELRPLDQQVKLRPDQYTVVNKANNRPAGAIETVTFDSQLQAEDFLAKEGRNNPAGAAAMQVIPATEVNLRA
ncbi:MAG: DUF6603 domain-containing protein [Bacteroidota bacterium]